MRYLTIIVFLAFLCNNLCYSQNTGTQDSLANLNMLETFPVFPGGDTALLKYFDTNMQYASKADKLNHDHIGLVRVSFTIAEDGSIEDDVRILKSVSEYYDQEAIRLIKAMPKWIPGTQKGIPVKVQYNLPIRF